MFFCIQSGNLQSAKREGRLSLLVVLLPPYGTGIIEIMTVTVARDLANEVKYHPRSPVVYKYIYFIFITDNNTKFRAH